jgi:hypothetical protein
MSLDQSTENLQAAIEQATSETHKRQFEVGGRMLTFPRLPIGQQGAFERYVRKTSDEKAVPFSLAATRNKAAMAMSGVITRAKRELLELQKQQGDPLTARTEEEAIRMASRLQDDVTEKFAPYADRIFSGLDRSHYLYAVAQSMALEYGPTITYMVEVKGKKEPITEPIDSAFVDKLFSAEKGNILENIFLWVVGLSEQVEVKAADLKAGDTIDDITKKTVGDAENSGREQN